MMGTFFDAFNLMDFLGVGIGVVALVKLFLEAEVLALFR